MVRIFGKEYFIDLDAITDACRIKPEPEKVKPKKRAKRRVTKNIEDNLQNDDGDDEILNFSFDDEEPVATINIFKYELIKMAIDRILNDDSIIDEAMGIDNTAISFRLAFNTLIKNKILLEDE